VEFRLAPAVAPLPPETIADGREPPGANPAAFRLWSSRRAALKNCLSLAIYAISVPLAYVSAIYFLPHAWIEPERPRCL
jgi:hypothetical protein